MADPDIPTWLKNLPLAPEYRPTETEFADPIAFISRVEREAAAFGICKVIPPVSKPSRKFVLSNLNRSLSKSPELGYAGAAPSSDSAVFTTRQQELGSRRARPPVIKQVWQSGEVYTVDQFEAKSKVFARAQLGGFKETSPLLVESLFWKGVAEKPIYIEYANDVPGSGFAVPEEPYRYIARRRNRKRGLIRGRVPEEKCGLPVTSSVNYGQQQKVLGSGIDWESRERTSGWKLSNSRWNLQVVARSPGSLTRFMPDEVPGVTSPMVYIGMLFSWFAWHVEDHELHSMNFLHMGSPKTWYAVPGEYAATMEEIVRVQGYGGDVDRLAAFIMLGEKTTLLSPEVLVASGVPCCRLVQHPGEFVVTFPRAYHVGFSHGFNCGEAANFATPEWLKVAKDAAIRRAAMNHLPMLSHQQMLYMLTMSFVARVPRALISGVRSSRLSDRKKEREILVKKAFLTDMMNENRLLCILLAKESTYSPVLWQPDMLPAPCAVSQSCPSKSLETHDYGDQKREMTPKECSQAFDGGYMEKPVQVNCSLNIRTCNDTSLVKAHEYTVDVDLMSSNAEALEVLNDEGDLPVGLNVDSGSLACVACGILGYPFMVIMQPFEDASRVIFATSEEPSVKLETSECSIQPSYTKNDARNSPERCAKTAEQGNLCSTELLSTPTCSLQQSGAVEIAHHVSNFYSLNCLSMKTVDHKGAELGVKDIQMESRKCDFQSSTISYYPNGLRPRNRVEEFQASGNIKACGFVENDSRSTDFNPSSGTSKELVSSVEGKCYKSMWDVSNVLWRPRVFCLRHAIDTEELLHGMGGGRIRVICHSDYVKIKAYATAVAEEIGTELHINDVPLENASQEDLNLINISIDEDEHQEDAKDWTSKLGLNLRHCVKLRKNSASMQGQLPSALSGIFSSSSPVSVVSSLRWLCRKSRTTAQPVGGILEKPRFISNVEGIVRAMKKANTISTNCIQVYQSLRKHSSDHNHPVKGLGYCEEIARVVDRRDHITSVIENADNLFAIPISFVENHEISQNIMEKRNIGPSVKDLNISGFPVPDNSAVESLELHNSTLSASNSTMMLSIPVRYQFNQLKHSISASSNSVTGNVEKQAEESDVVGYKCSSFQVDMTIPESSFEVKKFTRATIEEHSDFAFNTSIDLCTEQTLLLTADEDESIEGKQNREDCQRNALLSEDHSLVPQFSSDVSEMLIEDSITEKQGSSYNAVSVADEMGVQILVAGDSILEAGGHDVQSKQSFFVDECTTNNSIMQLKSCHELSTEDIPFTGYHCSLAVVAVRDEKQLVASNKKFYVRQRNKRKREAEQQAGEQYHIETGKTTEVQKEAELQIEIQKSSNVFVRSPCEGLRPRKGKAASEQTKIKIPVRRISATKISLKKASNAGTGKWLNAEINSNFVCDIDGCRMSFSSKSELQLHKLNRCTYEECGKRFSSHKYAMRHQRVHIDDRPLKCHWKGCEMSFKWEWARTEHLRLHTGEKPYRCKVAGCGLTFRFVSDFSRHRRKTGHYVETNMQ